MNHKNQKNIIVQKGQSLVEVALFLPIFLVLMAGMIEVSNIIVTQNKVTSAARASTRFGVNGGENEGMVLTALRNVTETLETDEDVWDIWTLRGTINELGTGFIPNTWEFEHSYGISNTKRFSDVVESEIQAQVLAELQQDQFGNTNQALAADLRFVGTYAMHDIDSILGLNVMPQYAELTSVGELSVMRVSGIDADNTKGCDGFPIVVYEGIRSVHDPADGNADNNAYPALSDIEGPDNPRTYESFIHHRDNVDLLDATEGTVFKIQNGSGPGQFGWLQWNEDISQAAGNLNDSLTWPGNARDYSTNPPRGFIEVGDPTDRSMGIGDYVAAGPGAVNASFVRATLAEHIELGRSLRLLIYSDPNERGGNNGSYKITRFGIFRLHGYHLPNSGGTWILAEFIRWDDSCGQTPPPTP